jgi:transcriptional regulator with XRE-family HTH domain
MSKPVQKAKVWKLRKLGLSIKEIAKRQRVSVGSVSNWCKDIKLSPAQIRKLKENARNPYYGKRAVYLASLKRKLNSKIKRLRKSGVRQIGELTKREFFLAGAALYWGEGFKKDKQAGLANLDPDLIKFFIRWLKLCFGYKQSDLIARITINNSHRYRVDKIHKYWSKQIGIPIKEFKKPTFQKFKWKKIYKNPEKYYGVLRIKVRKSRDFLRKIDGFLEGLKQNSV